MRRVFLITLALGLIGPADEAHAAPPTEAIDTILCRAASGEGFSYYWGEECWVRSGCNPDHSAGIGFCDDCNDGNGCYTCLAASTCCINSTSCQNAGPYGADCSGFVSKAWQVPNPHPVSLCHTERHIANDFTSNNSSWNPISMSDIGPADTVAKSTHVIFVYGSQNSSGNYEVVESMGCNYGIVRHVRSLSDYSHAARRINLVECTCETGDTETEDCGDCGTRTRTCDAGCSWTNWSPCEGPDPTGPDAACEADGVGQCANGTRLCVAGWNTCQPTPPSTEVCDGVDNDCDGQVDNGTPESLGEGYPCFNACEEGTSQCLNGAVLCVGPSGPNPTCDNPDLPDAGTTVDPTDPTDPDHPDSAFGGCSCGAPSPAAAFPGLLLGLLLGLLWRRRRR